MTEPSQLHLFNWPSQSIPNSTSKAIQARTGTFTDNMKLPIHRWFRYSAGFSADWVEQLIVELAPQTVLDPFAGSGTVCIAADKCQVTSFGVEAHPFVYKLSKGKLAWEANIQSFIEAASNIKLYAMDTPSPFPDRVPSLLNKCYEKDILIDLFKIKQAYFKLAPSLSNELQLLLFLAISAILRPSSHVGTAQWQYILPNKRKAKAIKPFEALERQVALMQEDMYVMQSLTQSSQATLLQEDARTLRGIPEQSIDLVITSPPYANNYDYADATRLEMTFWGEVDSWGDLHDTVRKLLIRSNSQHVSKERLDLEKLLSSSVITPIKHELIPICQELEAIRETKGGKKAYHTMVAAYFNDLGNVFSALRRVMVPDGNICFIIGDSAPYGVYVPVERWLGKLAVAAGFNFWSFEQIRQRNIKWKNRKHDVPLQEGRLWIKGGSMAQSPSHKFG